MTNSNKRLAKNTVFLYIRMVLLMIVSLYTSRITLQVLGVEDFGIYNLVGGVVVMIAFLSNALNASCSRFLSIAVGRNEITEIQSYFSASLLIHFAFSIILIIIFEFAGIWLIESIINIPEGRENATFWTYQFAIVSTISTVIRTPFNASVIANEKMDFFAWSGIAEGLLKLIVISLISKFTFDSLIIFSFLTCLVSSLITLIYVIYTRYSFTGNKLILRCNITYVKKMLSFGFWNVFIGAADVGWQQGTNIILNLFHGVSLNAAMGITNQVRTALYSLISNLQTAANPQIIKSYSQNDKERYCSLFYLISKYSFLLICFFSIPLLINCNYILGLWLGFNNIPSHTTEFVSLIILFSLIDNLIGPLWTINQAHGDIKFYSIIVSTILLLNLPATYVLFYLGMSPATMLIARIIILLISLSFQLSYTQSKTDIQIITYLKEVILPILSVSTVSILPSLLISIDKEGGTRFVLSISTFIPTFFLSSIFLGMKQNERKIIITFLQKHFKKNLHLI